MIYHLFQILIRRKKSLLASHCWQNQKPKNPRCFTSYRCEYYNPIEEQSILCKCATQNGDWELSKTTRPPHSVLDILLNDGFGCICLSMASWRAVGSSGTGSSLRLAQINCLGFALATVARGAPIQLFGNCMAAWEVLMPLKWQ